VLIDIILYCIVRGHADDLYCGGRCSHAAWAAVGESMVLKCSSANAFFRVKMQHPRPGVVVSMLVTCAMHLQDSEYSHSS